MNSSLQGMLRLARWSVCMLLGTFPITAPATEGLIWPTPNRAFIEGRPVEAYIQPTASGRVESGLYGCVRNGGSRFHEGIDLFPVMRSRSGTAQDPIYSVLPGYVAHVNRISGKSNYGVYVVVVHDRESPSFYTLYAHLASVASEIQPGARVRAGTVLGVMGRTPSHIIPRSRAHLHFEIGFKLTDHFQSWFDRQRFGSPNEHGNWNGMNLLGIDPLAYYRAYLDGRVDSMLEFMRTDPAAARIRIRMPQYPSFLENYPEFLMEPLDSARPLVGWEITFDRFGIPKAWTPLYVGDRLPAERGVVKLVAYNRDMALSSSCRPLVVMDKDDQPDLSKAVVSTIGKLFTPR